MAGGTFVPQSSFLLLSSKSHLTTNEYECSLIGFLSILKVLDCLTASHTPSTFTIPLWWQQWVIKAMPLKWFFSCSQKHFIFCSCNHALNTDEGRSRWGRGFDLSPTEHWRFGLQKELNKVKLSWGEKTRKVKSWLLLFYINVNTTHPD